MPPPIPSSPLRLAAFPFQDSKRAYLQEQSDPNLSPCSSGEGPAALSIPSPFISTDNFIRSVLELLDIPVHPVVQNAQCKKKLKKNNNLIVLQYC